MDTFTLGILVFAVFMTLTGLLMVMALRRHQASASSQPILQALLPYLVAEGIFIAVFVYWVLTRVFGYSTYA